MPPISPTLLLILASAIPAGAEPLGFNKDIRPILSENCFACHGLDPKTREAKLRLDLPESAFKQNKHGDAAIIPGKPEESLMWQLIIETDPDEVMPPEETHKKLTAAQKQTIKQWIEQGAPYQKHWAFEAPVKPAGEGIDHFVSKALGADGLQLSPEADRPTLIRRVSMVLTGLPATIADVDSFLNDKTEGAYERMVDRYLSAPAYGEEMARFWLDVARYGDTHGMHLDNERQIWAYRDWVVGAFNRNLPYDQFTIDQLAGDLLPNPTQDQLVATGFNRCNITTGEGGSIDSELIYRYAVDRASTTAQAWLGLTAACAVCHDHKYDPISQKEFYSLYAFFNSNADPAKDGNKLLTPPFMKVEPPGYDAHMKTFAEREAAIEKKMGEIAANVVYSDPAEADPKPPVETSETLWFDDAFPAGAKPLASATPLSFVFKPVAHGKKSLKVSGPTMAQVSYEKGPNLVVPDGAKFFLSIYLDPADPPEEVMLQFNTGAWSHRAFWGDDVIQWGKPKSTERFAAGGLPEAGEWVRLEFDSASVGLNANAKVKGFAFTVHGGTAYFDKFGFSATTDPVTDPAVSFAAWRLAQKGKDTAGVPNDLKAWLKQGPEAPRKPEELKRLREHYVRNVCSGTRGSFAPQLAELAAVRKERGDFDSKVPSTFIYGELPKPRDSFVMIRGQYDTPGEPVVPGTLAVLPELKQAGERANRLDLARWLVEPENPLTARVAVNRYWQQVFGIGLVETSHDFGTQGSLPSHPELLDWMAVWFRENGWDVKKLMRLMVTSKTFRQQSGAPAERWVKDPQNRQLARGPRFRLDAEQIRDQALFVSGLLVSDIGGKGVNPYQPPSIWEPLAFGGSNTRHYKQGKGDDLYRRTLYTFFKRTAPHPLFENFDAPNREQSCIMRDRTNTPLQALQLMNDVQHYEAARAFAGRIIAAAPGTDARIDFAFRSVLARRAELEEIALVGAFFQGRLAEYKAAPAEVKKAVTFGESAPPANVNEVELAAWTLIANLILNMDEAVVRN